MAAIEIAPAQLASWIAAIPTLEEVLEIAGDRMTVYCELKGEGVVEAAAPLMAAHRGTGAMHSFDHRAVLRAAALAPGVPRGILLCSRLVDTLAALESANLSASPLMVLGGGEAALAVTERR